MKADDQRSRSARARMIVGNRTKQPACKFEPRSVPEHVAKKDGTGTAGTQ